MLMLKKEKIFSDKSKIFKITLILLILSITIISAGMDFFHNHKNGLENNDNCPVAKLSVIFVFLFISSFSVLFADIVATLFRRFSPVYKSQFSTLKISSRAPPFIFI